MVKFWLLVFVSGVFIGCNSSSSSNSIDETGDDELAIYFPSADQPFLNLNFNEEMASIESKLKQNGYQKSGVQELDWANAKTKTQILLTDTEKLSNFRVLFFDQNEDFYEKLMKKLEKNATFTQKDEENDGFSHFQFQSKNADYDLTVFRFEKSIRLHFKPMALH